MTTRDRRIMVVLFYVLAALAGIVVYAVHGEAIRAVLIAAAALLVNVTLLACYADDGDSANDAAGEEDG